MTSYHYLGLFASDTQIFAHAVEAWRAYEDRRDESRLGYFRRYADRIDDTSSEGAYLRFLVQSDREAQTRVREIDAEREGQRGSRCGEACGHCGARS